MKARLIVPTLAAARQFFATEASGGILLIAMALVALGLANSSYADAYFSITHIYLGPLSLTHWINDALMALFFLVVGLEVKREILVGEMSSWEQRRLPCLAAGCGVIVPALIFIGISWNTQAALDGWAIPTATDIAFALAIIALLGNRVPPALKILLTAIAIIDDVIAVVIIAIFYTSGISFGNLGIAFAILGILFVFNRMRIDMLWLYILPGVGIWYFVYQSGVHATLAGVMLAMAIPLRAGTPESFGERTPLHLLEDQLHPWVAYLVVPLFGFINAGVALGGASNVEGSGTVAAGVAIALVVGKQLGIFGAIRLAVTIGWSNWPKNSSWLQIFGMSALCGIGFTMSLFIGLLAYGDDSPFAGAAKLGILAGSVVSAMLGWSILRFANARTDSS